MHQIIDDIAGYFLPQKQVKPLFLQWFSRANPLPGSINIEVCPPSLSQPLISARNPDRSGSKYHLHSGGE
jgi:hypothetical protein